MCNKTQNPPGNIIKHFITVSLGSNIELSQTLEIKNTKIYRVEIMLVFKATCTLIYEVKRIGNTKSSFISISSKTLSVIIILKYLNVMKFM